MGPGKQESRNGSKLRRLGRLGLQLFTTFLGKARGGIAETRSDNLRGRSVDARPDKGFTGCPTKTVVVFAVHIGGLSVQISEGALSESAHS